MHSLSIVYQIPINRASMVVFINRILGTTTPPYRINRIARFCWNSDRMHVRISLRISLRLSLRVEIFLQAFTLSRRDMRSSGSSLSSSWSCPGARISSFTAFTKSFCSCFLFARPSIVSSLFSLPSFERSRTYFPLPLLAVLDPEVIGFPNFPQFLSLFT